MPYSELIKNFQSIRDYMRQFYVYGFKSRSEYDVKSARTYDDVRRRMESWLGEYMSFRQRDVYKRQGMHIQYNVISSDILREAQKKPEEFRDLVIRVAGFSAYFVELYKDLQDDLISRTDQE